MHACAATMLPAGPHGCDKLRLRIAGRGVAQAGAGEKAA